MKYGFVIFPSKKLQDLANSYRKRYDPNYSLITPHLTLKTPFEATDEEINTLSMRLSQVAKEVAPFTLNAYKVSSFYPVNKVIYFKVEPKPELVTLHDKLYADIFNEKPEYAFVPHITIGQQLSDDEHSDVLGQLKMLSINHEEEIDRFHLLYQLENGSWTVYETFRLGKGC